MSDQTEKYHILEILKSVKYPGYSRDIVSFGFVKNIQVEAKSLRVEIQLNVDDPKVIGEIYQTSNSALRKNTDYDEIHLDVKSAPNKNKIDYESQPGVPGVKKVIAIASGKGGVGKSTLAANLAIALAKNHKVGLCDCDLYGPSSALIFGAEEQTPRANAENRIVPIEAFGVKVISMGFLLDDNSPVIVRGPIATRYTQQFLTQVQWQGENEDPLDYLILDLPPGTGDIHLTIAQSVKVDGAIIVSTPQELALIDARKAVSMFKTVNVPIIGLVENMSYYLCPDCGTDAKKQYLFGKGGGKRDAVKIGAPFLGEIPLNIETRESCDLGKPVALKNPKTNPISKIFANFAKSVTKTIKA